MIYLLSPPAVFVFLCSFLPFCSELKQKWLLLSDYPLIIITPINTQMLMVFDVLIITNA